MDWSLNCFIKCCSRRFSFVAVVLRWHVLDIAVVDIVWLARSTKPER